MLCNIGIVLLYVFCSGDAELCSKSASPSAANLSSDATAAESCLLERSNS